MQVHPYLYAVRQTERAHLDVKKDIMGKAVQNIAVRTVPIGIVQSQTDIVRTVAHYRYWKGRSAWTHVALAV